MTITVNHPLVILVPSRSRPHNIAELLDAWDTTAVGGHAELVVAVDDDDPKLDAYLDLWTDAPDWARLHVGPRLRLGGTLNALGPQLAAAALEHADPDRDIAGIGFLGDDHRPRSLGWDEQLAEELIAANPYGVIYGNDLIQGAALPTAVILDARIVHRLGYMVPPGAVHLFLDNYWKVLGERLGTLRYRADIVIEHAHPIAGRAAWDDQYREVNADAIWTADEALFRRYVAEDLADAITLIRNP